MLNGSDHKNNIMQRLNTISSNPKGYEQFFSEGECKYQENMTIFRNSNNVVVWETYFNTNYTQVTYSFLTWLISMSYNGKQSRFLEPDTVSVAVRDKSRDIHTKPYLWARSTSLLSYVLMTYKRCCRAKN